jgi:hypothetical protein
MRTNRRFETLFDDMAKTRHRYELLRISGGSLDERSALLTRLQSLRAEMASQRPPMV